MSVLCLCTSSIHQSTRNVTHTGKILPSPPLDTLCEQQITPSQEIPTDELALLAKLEEANRLIESDAKSLNSLQSNHSRKGSDTSQVSVASGGSGGNGDAALRRHNPADGEENTWTLWGHIVSDWDYHWKKRKEFVKELVRQGIPHHFRGIVWQLLSGAHDSPVKKQFAEYIKATSACERIIRRDIARTYPEHDFFKEKDGLGQESLFNVMKAYSLHDREVGYCQGSGFIVGLLLMQQMPEEEAFAVLVALMQEYRLRDMFKPSMAELGVCMYQLEHLVADTHPELHAHFTAQGFHTSMYASSWFLTLFTTALSLPLACRIFDVFLSEGMEIIFKVALAMLHLGKEDLLSLDMEGMLKFFQKQLPGKAEKDPDGLMTLAYGMKINTKRMKKLEKDYTILKMKEQEEMVELRRLRADNRLLRQRTELLEAESAELADRLVRGQVSRAEEEETAFIAQRELAALRHSHLETSHQLEQAHEELRSLSILLEENMTSRQSSLDEILVKQEALSQKEEMIQCLQEELVRVRLHEAENDALIRELRGRIQELEQDKKTLRESTPDNSVAHLQEELIAVKLREAEANLSLKDLRQRVVELSAAWQRHLQEHRSAQSTPAADSTPKKLLFWENRGHEVQKFEEDLMTTRIREMEALTEVKELRLKVMELETQVQVATNQLRRQDEGGKVLKDHLEAALAREKDLAAKLREQQHKYSDLESKMKDEAMMARIRDAEHAQQVAELTQKISLLELKNEEMHAEGELRNNLDDSEKVRELQDKVAELKAEVMRLESWKQRWTGLGGQTVRSFSVDTESELDERDLRICLQDHINTTTPNSPENVDHKMKFRSKKGQLPFVELNGEEIADSTIILRELSQKFGKDLDAGLTSEQRSVSHAMISMIENHLVWVVACWRTKNLDQVLKGYKVNLQLALGSRIPNAILNFFFKLTFGRKGARKVKAQGMGVHSPEEVSQFGCTDLKVLSDTLADKPFFFGDEPTTMDVVAFAHLAQILYIDKDTPYSLRDYMVENCPNLVGHCSRVKERCFPDWDEICSSLDMNTHLPKPEKQEEKEGKEEAKESKESKEEKEGDKEKADKEEKEVEKDKEVDENKEKEKDGK